MVELTEHRDEWLSLSAWVRLTNDEAILQALTTEQREDLRTRVVRHPHTGGHAFGVQIAAL